MADPPPTDAQLIQATERWFLQRGTPHFIEEYRASEDVFSRTLPFLTLVFLVEVLGAAKRTWPWWQNALAVAGGLGVLLGAFALLNVVRHRRWSQRPDAIGAVELAAFVLVPALLPALFGNQYRAAAGTVLANLVLLGVAYLFTSYAIIPVTRWALGQTIRQVGAVLDLFGRALPLLLLFSVALFINTEVWQVSASLDGVLFWVTITFFVLAGLVFLLIRLPGEVGQLRDQLDGPALVAACEGSPLAEAAVHLSDVAAVERVPLTKRQQGNVLLVLLFSQAVQVLLVTITIGSFFFLFGLIAIRPQVIDAWLGEIGPGQLASWTWFGHDLRITRALLHVSGFLGAISGFYFTVYVITDSTYRAEFFTEIVDQVRQSLAVRNVYLTLRARPS